MTENQSNPPKGVTEQAFERLAEKNAAQTPEERDAQKAKMQSQIEEIKNRGGRVVEDSMGHRLTLGATGPVVGGPLLDAEEGR